MTVLPGEQKVWHHWNAAENMEERCTVLEVLAYCIPCLPGKVIKPLFPPKKKIYIWQFLEKLKIGCLYDPATPLLGIHLTELKAERYLCIHVHGSILDKSPKMEAIQVSVGRWMYNTMWSTHPVEYYLALKGGKFWQTLQCGWTLRALCCVK